MLFKIEPNVTNLIPGMFGNACKLASRILRSEFHANELCSLHFNRKTSEPHIDERVLSAFLAKNEVLVLDKIRNMKMLGECACTERNYDPFKIYLNPLLLLEMIDREREAVELDIKSIDKWPDLTKPVLNPFDDAGDPVRRHHNSLVLCQQQQQLQQKQAKLSTAAAGPPKKAAKTSGTATPSIGSAPIVPTDLSVDEKHTWMLAMLLVHHADHLLTGLFSSCLNEDGTTPEKMMRLTDQLPFTDIGHMMELQLYGFVIRHGFDDLAAAPFAIQKVLGATHTHASMPNYALTPSVRMRALFANPDDLSVPITSDVLAAAVTGDGFYKQQQTNKPIKFGSSNKNESSADDTILTVKQLSVCKNVFDTWKA